MGHGDDGARVVLEVFLQPGHGLGVEVVGGLIQEQDVGLLDEEAAERHAAPLAAGEHLDGRLWIGAAQGVHGLLQLRIQVPAVRGVDLVLQLTLAGHQLVVVGVGIGEGIVDRVVFLQPAYLLRRAFLDRLADGLGFVQLGLLLQEACGIALGQNRLTVEVLVHPRHDAQHRGLARTVETQHADLRAVVVPQADVLDDGLVVVDLGHPVHRVDDFGLLAGGLGHEEVSCGTSQSNLSPGHYRRKAVVLLLTTSSGATITFALGSPVSIRPTRSRRQRRPASVKSWRIVVRGGVK